MPGYFVKSLRVEYRDDAVSIPSDIIPEINTGAPDINKGFGGSFVYLVQDWTEHSEEACSYIAVQILDHALPDRNDLAKGSGGKYRYLDFQNDEHVPKIKQVSLFRKSNSAGPITLSDIEPHGYKNYSADINAGRGGDYLALIWKT